jgi:hypothetical protein
MVWFVLRLNSAEMTATKSYQFYGACDASAAVALSDNTFVVANDEDNVLRVYPMKDNSRPLRTFDLTRDLAVTAKHPEVDLEAGAWCGEYVYWISSHGRNSEGKSRPNRHRLFATSFTTSGDKIEMKLVGRPCSSLLSHLIAEPRFASFRLEECSKRAPKDPDALNIEGLCATAEKHLLIGFRNPVPGGKALLIPLLNPGKIIRGESPKFGDALLLDLKGLGIRDMTFHQGHYYIIAGSISGDGSSQLYSTPDLKTPPEVVQGGDFGSANPEAICARSDKPGAPFHILMDNGSKLVDGTRCKDVKDPAARSFPSFVVTINPKP